MRCKKKGAFYNCFALILRIKHLSAFKEIHVKVFNTGKLEIPGIQSDEMLVKTLELLCDTLRKISIGLEGITWDNSKNSIVLINSNFTCGYYINREKLYHRLKYHYGINSAFDPCSYPGIQSKFYYDHSKDRDEQTGIPLSGVEKPDKDKITEISFMIFRTGSILIVGMCDEVELVNECATCDYVDKCGAAFKAPWLMPQGIPSHHSNVDRQILARKLIPPIYYNSNFCILFNFLKYYF